MLSLIQSGRSWVTSAILSYFQLFSFHARANIITNNIALFEHSKYENAIYHCIRRIFCVGLEQNGSTIVFEHFLYVKYGGNKLNRDVLKSNPYRSGRKSNFHSILGRVSNKFVNFRSCGDQTNSKYSDISFPEH